MSVPNRVELEALALSGLPPARYRRRVKDSVQVVDKPSGVAYRHGSNAAPRGLLTDAEQFVLAAFAEGLRPGEVAAQLDMTMKTFYAICDRLRRALGARNDVHAVSIAFRRGLLPTERRAASTVTESDMLAALRPLYPENTRTSYYQLKHAKEGVDTASDHARTP